MNAVEIIFWCCLVLVVYTYVGYGIILYLIVLCKRALGFSRKEPEFPAEESLPDVTLMVCAYNEQDVVEMKMDNTNRLDYPNGKLHVVWVTDGSTDDTNSRLSAYPNVEIRYSPERKGKTAALNRGISLDNNEIIIMTDANTMINEGAIKEVVRLFQDPKVGCVSGEKKVMARSDEQSAAKGEGLYWKYESALKRLDSELSSAMGAAGELCAVRRHLYTPMPEDTLLDDFIMSLKTVQMGYRIAYTSEAYAMEYGSADINEEQKRKQRIAAGGLQSLWRLRSMFFMPSRPWISFQFVSHRAMRWSVTPFALLALVPLNVWLVLSASTATYITLWLMQLAFYAMATAGYLLDKHGRKNKLCYTAYYFLFMNVNVFRGIRYLMNKKGSGAWEKAKRG